MKSRSAIIAAVLILCALVSCKSTVENVPKVQDSVKADIAVPLGWIDSDTFRARAEGQGKDSAISGAQQVVIEKFITERIKSSGMKFDPKSTGVSIVNEFGDTVKGGSVIREKTDEGGRVTIIYEVKSGDLKSRVLGNRR